jgi:hypothetical protein
VLKLVRQDYVKNPESASRHAKNHINASVLFASVIFSIFMIKIAFAGLALLAIPPGVQYYLPITLTNYQGTAVTANTQIAIGTNFIGGNALSAANTLVTGFNALAYQQYEACNLQNVEFFFANGTVINSWLEGNIIANGASNSLCTSSSSPNSLSESANVLWWINYPWSSSFLPANTGTATTNTIYMGFASPSSSVINGNNVGEAPTLSSKYAEYDNGAKVFLSYFNGDTPTGDFTISSGYTLAQLTGAVMPDGSTGNVIHITGYGPDAPFTYNNGYPIQPSIVEASSQLQSGSLSDAQGIVAVLNSQTVSSASGIGVTMGFATTYFSQEYLSSGTGTTDQNRQGSAVSSWVYGAVNFTGTSSSSWTGYIAPQLYSKSGGFGNILTTQPIKSGSELYLSNLGASDVSYPYKLYINWERARAYPPNGILPATTFGSVTLAGCSASITTPSNSIADAGQYESFTASENDCVSSFTYNIIVANSITPSVITHNDLLTGQTANSVTYTFQTTSTDISNSPEEANVIVTDSGANTVSSEYSTFTINPALTTPTAPTPTDPTIDSGQSITLSSSWSGGTPDYTVKWYTGPSGNTCSQNSANVLATYSSVSATSNSITVTPTSTNSYCIGVTDSATTPTTATSGTDVVNVNSALSTPSITPSNPTLDSGQSVTFSSTWTGGTPDYIAKLYSSTTSSCSSSSTLVQTLSSLTSGSASFSSVSPTSTTYYCIFVTDSASTPATVNSINSEVVVNSVLGIPSLSSSPSLPSTQNVGNTITFTASWSGGTSTYTANYLIVNTITGNLVANMLFTGITGTTNSFAWAIPSNLAGNTLAANVFITDSANTPETTNSVKTGTLTVIATAPTTPTLSNCPSSAKLDVGQTVSCTASFTGGTSPYTYNWLISNSAKDAITANMLFTGVSSTSNTFTYTTVSADTSNSPEQFNVIVTDAASETVNSIYSSTFTINPALTTPTAPTPTDPTIDSGQSITLSSSWSGGTPTYTIKWYTGPSGNTCSQDSSNVLATYSSVSVTSNSITVTPTSTNSYCIGVTDSATTPITELSSNDVVFVNAALGTPSLAASNTPTVDTGQYEAFSSSWTGGTLPYTANYLVFNTVTDALVANALYTGITVTSNTFLWLVPTADAGNTISANVFITDSASNPVTVNSVQLSVITIFLSTTTSTTSTSTSTSTTSSTTLTTTVAPSGSGGGSGSGGIIIHPPSTSVSSTSTSSTSTSSTSTSSTSTTSSASTSSTSSTSTVRPTISTSTIKPVIIAKSAKISPGVVTNINFTSYNLTVKVRTNSNITKNVTIELYRPVNLNATLQNYTDIFSFYLNASSSGVSMNVTLVYDCKYGSAVAPFVVENGTPNQIYNAVLLQNPCRITFSAPNRHLIGLFAYTPKQATSSTTSISTSATTTYVQTELPVYDAYYIVAAAIAVAIIAYIIWMRMRNR